MIDSGGGGEGGRAHTSWVSFLVSMIDSGGVGRGGGGGASSHTMGKLSSIMIESGGGGGGASSHTMVKPSTIMIDSQGVELTHHG